MQNDNELLDLILGENDCPVARMRLYSNGINQNTRVLFHEKIVGDKGCLSCGNCVDACPVIKEKIRLIFVHTQRTSMALETIVGNECRRCYSCINSCPQVEKSLKEYALGYRRGKKIVHMLFAMTIVFLALTGMISLHYSDILPGKEVEILKYIHRILGVFFILLPFLYYVLEKRHMLRLFSKVFKWNKSDWLWAKQLVRHIINNKKYPMPLKTEFNPGQKVWYLYIIIVIPFLALTGLTLLVESFYPNNSIFMLIRLIHMIIALTTDLFLFIHIYIKYLRNWALLIFDIVKVFKEKRKLNYALIYNNGKS